MTGSQTHREAGTGRVWLVKLAHPLSTLLQGLGHDCELREFQTEGRSVVATARKGTSTPRAAVHGG